ncbi:sirohydrochlorin chelatase [Rhodococcus triatomae]|uniref:Sirohydrochlorin ferrochelatase n=1 Tax=Rhodococcus triatomae TaxID=300028 RepID=A0A1G8DKR1_9NOCA|nr:sirohydrochlorin chelatase [Rhodococcus triatomae]QNG18404.1 sirohydrochlorin chelatase [Rhodococcus triatomae]QNG21926.1 sirohydrochlorin chelatase [Rhodococcus triatomae]SDH58274.1 Sirohydrochlorin ferrochelatase [Rhodococcus triatomae]
MTPLIAVAHGSRDPRSAGTVAAAVAAVRARRPELDVRLCFLDLSAPSVDRILDSVAAEGHRSAVVVPLLLGSAFHARVDLPALLRTGRDRHPLLRTRQAEVLGQDERLLDAVRDRVRDTGAPRDGLGVVLAAVGSSDPEANARTAALADRLRHGTGWAGVSPCFATAAEPTIEQAVADLRARGCRRLVVAPWFLAPGLLTDRLARAVAGVDDVTFAAPIGAHPRLAEVVLDRYEAALSASLSRGSLSA